MENKNFYLIGGKEFVRVTRVTSLLDAGKSEGLIRWAAKCTAEWIKKNCDGRRHDSNEDGTVGELTGYIVTPEDLESAPKHFKEISSEALDVGSLVHDHIHHYLKMGHVSEHLEKEVDEVKHGMESFLRWNEKAKLEPLFLEQVVYSVRFSYAGRTDFIGYATINGERDLWTIDWKSSKYHYPHEHGPQVAAYVLAANEMDDYEFDRLVLPHKIKRCGVLRVDKDSGKIGPRSFRDYTENIFDYWNVFVDLRHIHQILKEKV